MAVNILIGTTIYRRGSYVIEKYLSNQKKIQQNYQSSDLVLATTEPDFARELENHIKSWNLKGHIVLYKVVKPDTARSYVWNIACGREAIREHTLSQTKYKYLLLLDADMTYETTVVDILLREIQGYDVVFSGYPLYNYGIGLAGAGCAMFTTNILKKLKFRCHEFKSGEVIFEDNLLEMDLFQSGSRIKKGFFVSIQHHISPAETRCITPRPVGILRKMVNSALVRYVLIRVSLMVHFNIPWRLKVLFNKFLTNRRKRLLTE